MDIQKSEMLGRGGAANERRVQAEPHLVAVCGRVVGGVGAYSGCQEQDDPKRTDALAWALLAKDERMRDGVR